MMTRARPELANDRARGAPFPGTLETLPGTWAPPGSRHVELVFRTVGERTSSVALDLALAHIRPQRAHVVRGVTPLTNAVRRMLTEIDLRGSHILVFDADCLVLDDLRPFLDANDLPFVCGYVHDRFRGRANSGMHLTRIDVIETMRDLLATVDELAYAIRVDDYLRNLALARLGLAGQVQHRNFPVLHDHLQRYTDVFAKFAYRELRNRSYSYGRACLEAAIARWGPEPELAVARRALRYAAETVPPNATAADVDRFVRGLRQVAADEVSAMGLEDRADPATPAEVAAVVSQVDWKLPAHAFKVFGIGLPGTGTRSLARALSVLGFDTVHPICGRPVPDAPGPPEPEPSLDLWHGLTGPTAASSYRQLDRAWPGSKFVLTVRDEEHWLISCRSRQPGPIEWAEIEQLRRAYRRHTDAVRSYFSRREDDLLVLDVASGEGYEKLAAFLGVPDPRQPFPHRAARRSRSARTGVL